MSRVAVLLLGALMLIGGSGCAMCGSEFDDDYAAYGGSWERHNRNSGRVGSLFDSAGEKVAYGQPRKLDESLEDEGPAGEEESMDAPTVPDSEEPTDAAGNS